MKRVIFLSFFALAVFLISCNEENTISPESNFQESESSYGDNPEVLEKRGRYAMFEVTVENLTPSTEPGASQPFSPPVIATHIPRYNVFEKNRYASSELGQLAEDAVNAPLVKKLENSKRVFSVVEGTEGPIFPSEAQTFMIKTQLPFVKLSLVSMLVNTNDAFAGANSISLPFRGTKVMYLKAYDAGTEMNTESHDHIPGPCCGSPLVRVPTHEKIKVHPGIMGNSDLDPAIYGWTGNVAKLSITRIQ